MKKALSLFLALLMAFGSFGSVLARGDAPAAAPAPTGNYSAFLAEEEEILRDFVPPTEEELKAARESAPAVRADQSGTCGDNLNWYLTESTGVLRIYGTGAMTGYNTSTNRPPWYDYKSQITSVVIEEGVTSIGSYAFYLCSHITTVSIPASVTSINGMTFGYTEKLQSFTVASGSQYFRAVDGVLFSNDKTKLYAYPAARAAQQYSVPEEVTYIYTGAFSSSRW